jgi:hypothetical protein
VYTNNSHFGSPRVSLRGTPHSALRSFCAFSVFAQDSSSSPSPVTGHGSRNTVSITCLLDRLPVPRTCILGTIGANLSLQQTFYGSPFLLFLCGRV